MSVIYDKFYSINNSSEAYGRINSGGFKIIDRILRETDHDIFRFDWICYCGKQEAIDVTLSRIKEKYLIGRSIDVAQIIEDVGAISEEHLIADGFSQEEIKVIRKAYV